MEMKSVENRKSIVGEEKVGKKKKSKMRKEPEIRPFSQTATIFPKSCPGKREEGDSESGRIISVSECEGEVEKKKVGRRKSKRKIHGRKIKKDKKAFRFENVGFAFNENKNIVEALCKGGKERGSEEPVGEKIRISSEPIAIEGGDSSRRMNIREREGGMIGESKGEIYIPTGITREGTNAQDPGSSHVELDTRHHQREGEGKAEGEGEEIPPIPPHGVNVGINPWMSSLERETTDATDATDVIDAINRRRPNSSKFVSYMTQRRGGEEGTRIGRAPQEPLKEMKRQYVPTLTISPSNHMRSLTNLLAQARPQTAATGESNTARGFKRYITNATPKPPLLPSTSLLLANRLNHNKLKVSNLLSITTPLNPTQNNNELTITQFKDILSGKPSPQHKLILEKSALNSHPPKTEFDLLYSMKELNLHQYPLIAKAHLKSRKFIDHSLASEHLLGDLVLTQKEMELFTLFEGAKVKIMQSIDTFTNQKAQLDIYQLLTFLQNKYLHLLENNNLKEIKEKIKDQRDKNEREVKEGLRKALNSNTCHIDFQKFDALLKEQTNLFEKTIKRIEQANKGLETQRNKAIPIDTHETFAELDNNSFRSHYAEHRGFFCVIKHRMRNPAFKGFHKKFVEIEKSMIRMLKNQDVEGDEGEKEEIENIVSPQKISSKIVDLNILSPIDEYRNLWDVVYKFLTSNAYLKGCYPTIFQSIRRTETDIYEKLFKVNYKSIELFLYDFMIGMISKQLLEEKMNNLATLQKIINIQRIFRLHLQKFPTLIG